MAARKIKNIKTIKTIKTIKDSQHEANSLYRPNVCARLLPTF
jgi:hypothetical protein